MSDPAEGKGGNEIGEGEDLFHETEHATERAAPATEEFKVKQARHRGPKHIAEFTQEGDGVGEITHCIQQDTEGQGRLRMF